ncbi:MAG: TolC family protein [Pseudopedobacter saltans]|uniref:TolC family protein n=1 Tax=Pseudopedobacter saltans TaxID=151895 RepID=A0A2W5EN12_9SPHI|nr:MAG: TolC family protein [Pseudopedobacter saltans]
MITQIIKIKKQLLCFVLILSGITAEAQNNYLDKYVDTALQNNLVLQRKNITIERAQLSLKIAKSYYLPNSSFQMGYQTADGGRVIPLPLGDMLNGVYSTLNSITNTQNFPQLANENVQFLPKNFYDAKLHTTMPIYDADIHYGKKLAELQVGISEMDLGVYKKDLIRDVKSAYYRYLMALQTITIYSQALALSEESQRVNQKLLDNGKGLPAYVLRSESEVANVKAQITNANLQAKNARLYFNFLLNKPLSDSILVDPLEENTIAQKTLIYTKNVDVDNRLEIKSLERQQTINETLIAKNKAAFYPKLNTFLDLGSQAQDWHFNSQSRYYMFGVQLSVPIYTGSKTRNQIKQSYLDAKALSIGIEQAKQQYSVAAQSAINNLQSSIESFQAKQKQLEAASSYQRLIERGYKAGSNTYIETIDARSQLTNASIDKNIQAYQVLINLAEVERNIP